MENSFTNYIEKKLHFISSSRKFYLSFTSTKALDSLTVGRQEILENF